MKLIILVLLASAQSFKSNHQNRGTRSFPPSSYKETHYLSYLGSFNATKPEMHPLEGNIYYRLDDENVLTVINFVYPNPGPDAFFWAGENGDCDGDSIDNKSYNLIPGGRGHSDYFSQDQPILETYEGNQADLVLRLPKGVSVSDLRWLCVWCRKFKVNFGGIKINAKP